MLILYFICMKPDNSGKLNLKSNNSITATEVFFLDGQLLSHRSQSGSLGKVGQIAAHEAECCSFYRLYS